MYEGLREDAVKLKIEVSKEENKTSTTPWLQQLLSKLVKTARRGGDRALPAIAA